MIAADRWPRSPSCVDGDLTGPADAVVTGTVTLDSRTVEPGDLFVAIAGERVDGHDFLGAAAAAGAVAALSQPGRRRAADASWSADPSSRWAGSPPASTPG